MELTETIESINKQLRDKYSSDIVTGQSIFRVVFSDDQYEKRYGTYDDITPSGIFIRSVTEVREVPKYKQWIHQKYILERLVLVPEFNKEELCGAKLSYEPLWTFEDKNGNPLPPRIDACEFIINTVLAAQAVATGVITGDEKRDKLPTVRYKDDITNENHLEKQKQNIDKLVEELFGDESGLMGTTFDCGTSIIVPHKQGES